MTLFFLICFCIYFHKQFYFCGEMYSKFFETAQKKMKFKYSEGIVYKIVLPNLSGRYCIHKHFTEFSVAIAQEKYNNITTFIISYGLDSLY